MLNYDSIGRNPVVPEPLDYDKLGADDVVKRTPEEAKKIREQQEKEKDIARRREQLLEKGEKKPAEKPPLQKKKDEEPAEEKSKGTPKTKEEKTSVRVDKLLENIKKKKEVMITVTFSSDFDATKSMANEGKDPHFEWKEYVAVIDEELGGATVYYKYTKNLEGINLANVDNALHEAPFTEEMTINGKKVLSDDPRFKGMHEWVREEILHEGIKPKGDVSVHFFNLKYDPDKERPISSTSHFMSMYRGLFVPDKAHKNWMEEKKRFQQRKRLGPMTDDQDWEEVTKMVKEYERQLKHETDPKERTRIEGELKLLKDTLKEKKEEKGQREDYFMEQLRKQRELRKPEEHLFTEKGKEAGFEVYAAVFPPASSENSKKFLAILDKYNLKHDPNPLGWLSRKDFKSLAAQLNKVIEAKIEKDSKRLKDPEAIEKVRRDNEEDLRQAEKLLPDFLKEYISRAEQFEKEHPLDFNAKPDKEWVKKEKADVEMFDEMRRFLREPPKPKDLKQPAVTGLERGKFRALLSHLHSCLRSFYNFGTAIKKAEIHPVGGVENVKRLQETRAKAQTAVEEINKAINETIEGLKEREKANLSEAEKKFIESYQTELKKLQDYEESLWAGLVKEDKTDTVKENFNKKILEGMIAETRAHIEKLERTAEGKDRSPEIATLILKLEKRLEDFEKKLKVIDNRLVPKTDAARVKDRENLETAQKDLENQYSKLRAELKSIESKKTELELTPEELADMKKLDEGFDEAQADLRRVEKTLSLQSKIPAVGAARTLQSALDYFSKLYSICASTVLMKEKYEPEGIVYATEEMAVEADEKEDVPLTPDEMEHSLITKRDKIANTLFRFSGLPIKAKDKIKAYATDLKSDVKKYLDILGEYRTEVLVKAAEETERDKLRNEIEDLERQKKKQPDPEEKAKLQKSIDKKKDQVKKMDLAAPSFEDEHRVNLEKEIAGLEKKFKDEADPVKKKKIQDDLVMKRHELHTKEFERYRIPDSYLHHTKLLVEQIKGHEKPEVKKMGPMAEEELKQTIDNIIKAYKEGFTDDKIKALAEKKDVSPQKAAVSIKRHQEVMTKVLMDNFFEKWNDIKTHAAEGTALIKKDRPRVKEDSPIGEAIKAHLPDLHKQKIPEKADIEEAPEKGVPTPKEILDEIVSTWSAQKELSHEDLIQEYKSSMEEHGGGGGGGGAKGRTRAKAIKPNPPAYVWDMIKEDAARDLVSGNGGPHLVDKAIARFFVAIEKQLKGKMEKDEYMDPADVRDSFREMLFNCYNTLMRLNIRPDKWEHPPAGAPAFAGPPDLIINNSDQVNKILHNFIAAIEEINYYLETDKYTIPPDNISKLRMDKKRYLPNGFVEWATLIQDNEGKKPDPTNVSPKYKGEPHKPLPHIPSDAEKKMQEKSKHPSMTGKPHGDYGNYSAEPAKQGSELYDYPTQMSLNVAAKFAGLELPDNEFDAVMS